VFFIFVEGYDIKNSVRNRMKDYGIIETLSILIVIIGFVLKLDSILIIMFAAIVTALVAGMDPVTFLETLGSSFIANRSMCVFVMVMVFAVFNVSFGGVAGFVCPIVLPMATAAAKKNGKKVTEKYEENLKGMASGMENIAWFFGQVLFVGTSGMILVQSTLADLGYDVELVDLMKVQIPVAIIAVGVAIVYYYLKDKQLSRRETK
jgi:uncharacterized membrane protein